MPDKKKLNQMIALTETQRADIDINEARFEGHEVALTSVIKILEKIGGEDRVIELLELGEIQLKIARREEAVSSIREEAGKSWLALRKALYIGRDGKVMLHFISLEDLVQTLGESRSQMLNGLGRVSTSRYLGPREVAGRLPHASPLTALPEREEKPFDPTREKATYQAMTIGGRTERGKRAIEITRQRASKTVETITDDSLIRAIAYYQIILRSLLKVHTLAKGTQDETTALFEALQGEGSEESKAELAGMFNYDLSSEQVIELSAQLIQRIEFILKLLEKETGVDNILTRLVPGRQLALLKKKIENEIPDGPDRDCAIGVIDRALQRRHTAKHGQKKLPEALQRRLGSINLLGTGTKKEDTGK